MPKEQYKLWKQLNDDGLYTKSYGEFVKQFSDTAKAQRLYSVLTADKYYTRTVDDFAKQFFPQTLAGESTNKYQSTRNFSEADTATQQENIATEKLFAEKYGDKNLWTRYAYINSDEKLKDMLVKNENMVDPYTLAGALSAEGIVDELVGARDENPFTDINEYYKGQSIDSKQSFGADDFLRRAGEFEQKGLTKLKVNMGERDQETLDSSYIPGNANFYNEKGELMKPVNFMSPKAGINAVSAYYKNIENIVDNSGVEATPEEKEILMHVGYNFGEGGLKQYLKKGKTAKVVIDKIKEERPQVWNNVKKRISVSQELRERKSLEPIEPIKYDAQ